MQQAVQKVGVDRYAFDLSRMSHVSVDIGSPKLVVMHISENISINYNEPWISPKGKRTKNEGQE